jgi:uncharacterized protein YndB with AHSA1/START domain
MNATNTPTATAQMMIRKPVSEVFKALTDPEITTQFWFTKSSGRVEKGKTLTWHWEMYGASGEVRVLDLIPNEQISIEWGNPSTRVDFIFTPLAEDKTYVVIKNYGFKLEGKELIAAMLDSNSGFTTLLDNMKACLEHNLKLNLVADKYPKGIMNHGKG